MSVPLVKPKKGEYYLVCSRAGKRLIKIITSMHGIENVLCYHLEDPEKFPYFINFDVDNTTITYTKVDSKIINLLFE